MKTLMIAAALCAGMMSAQAQSTPTDPKTAPMENKTSATTPQKPVQHPGMSCMTATNADWKSLGLSADQVTKVSAIQAECKKECAGKMDGDASTAMVSDKHEARIKEVLTPAQNDAWMKWCSAQATPAKPMEKK